MIPVRQVFSDDRLDNPPEELIERVRASGLLDRVKPGMRIAVAAGSRGIHGIDAMLRTLVDLLREAGAEPFIVGAMGSHGGGTAEGQREMLESLGITPQTMDVPVLTDIESVPLGVSPSGITAYMDRNAFNADGIVLMNRIKIHTFYHGDVESGLCKMVAVGLGKREAAAALHRAGLGPVIVESFQLAREKSNILFGIGILENARDVTLDLTVAAPEDFERVDSELLVRSRAIVPRIPFDSFDILVVDEMGKNISGTGMDTNVIGFWRRFGGERLPDYKTLIVRDLTPESHGNAMGIGLADLIPRRLADKIDWTPTYTNGITSGTWNIVKMPIVRDSDRDCIETALTHLGSDTPRIVWIKNTLDLEHIAVSGHMRRDVEGREDLEITGEEYELAFDVAGNIKK